MSAERALTRVTEKTHWIEFVGDRSVRIREGQTILSASLQAGIPHYHACGGNGQCSTCRVYVYSGETFLTPPTEKEKALRNKIVFPPHVRLACQTQVTGAPVLLHRIIRDETDIQIYIDEHPSADLLQSGHERVLALFFLDVRNFTSFLETYLPFDVIHMMRRLFSLFRKGIESQQGRIIETAGDGLYAVFGFDTNIEKASLQAYRAAQKILAELEDFNRNYVEKNFFYHFQVGIGLHAGNVIVGNIGIGVNNNLTVMGLAVNIASRLQAATRSMNNTLVVSDQFYQYLSPRPASKEVLSPLKGLTGEYRLHLLGKPFTDTNGMPT